MSVSHFIPLPNPRFPEQPYDSVVYVARARRVSVRVLAGEDGWRATYATR